MKQININVTPVYLKNYQAKNQIVINRGGAGSSKSYSVLQLIVIYFLTIFNLRILILRKTLPANKHSCLVVVREILSHFICLRDKIKEIKTELEFYNLHNNSYIKFGQLKDPERIKSSEWDYIVLEEATEFTYQDFLQCKLRLKRTTVDHIPQVFLMFNPTDEFTWIKTFLIDTKDEHGNSIEDYIEIVSNYKDNPFLSKRFVRDLENTINLDPAWYNVYCLGMWQSLGNRVYGSFKTIDMTDFVIDSTACLGLDVGIVSETALIIHKPKSEFEIYERELIYQNNTALEDIIKTMDTMYPFIKDLNLPIYVDYAARGAIELLIRNNYNAYPANKSVFDGINYCRKLIYNITSESVNLIKEHKAYSWQVNRNGTPIDKPIGVFDHLMDSRRYSVYTHFFDRLGIRPSNAVDTEPESIYSNRLHYNYA